MAVPLAAILAAAAPLRAQLFVDVTTAAGLTDFLSADRAMATGAAAADFDGDGWVDIYLPTSETTPNRLYRNRGDGTFEEIAAAAGVTSPGVSRVALWFDCDGDGDLDLVVGGDCRNSSCAIGESALRLYRQEADHSFSDVTASAGLFSNAKLLHIVEHRSGLAAGDLDNDGDLELYAGMWGLPRAQLFFNAGDGTFVDRSSASGANSADHHWQPVIHDFDGDGWQDIFVAIDFTANRLWLNQRDGSFVDVAPAAGVDGAFNEMGVALGDYDGDGDFDIYVTNIHELGQHNRLYRNDSTPGLLSFSGVATTLGVEDTDWGWGVTFIDGDNEGLLDIAATNGFNGSPWGTDPSKYFENLGGAPPVFADASAAVGHDDTYWGSALLAFDYDRDGDLDLVQSTVGDEGPARLRLLENRLEETLAANHYLNVRPRMAGPNSHAIGAVIRLLAGTAEQLRLITAGTSLLGQEPAEAFFGLGAAAAAERLELRWPDGVESRFDAVAADRLLTVWRGAPADLGVTLDDGVAEIDAPGQLTYTLVVRNLGPGDVTGATLTASLPPSLGCGAWSCLPVGGSCASASPPGDLTEGFDLLVGGELSWSVDCAVSAADSGRRLEATATVAGPAESAEPNPADNLAGDLTVVMGAGACGDPEHRYLTALTISDRQLYRACSSITTGDGVVVGGSGELLLEAPLVVLGGELVVAGELDAGSPP